MYKEARKIRSRKLGPQKELEGERSFVIGDWCSYCDFRDLDNDPEDCTCEHYCGEMGCSGDQEIEDAEPE